MKKSIYVYTRFDRRHVWEDSHAYTEKADAVAAARHQLDHLTAWERKDNDLYVTGYEIDLEDGDTRTAETIYSDLLDDDRLCDLHPYDSETRELFFICTVAEPFYDPRDQITDPLPDDEAEREAILAEIDEWMVEQYRQTADERLDTIIEEAEREEAYDA